MGPRDYFLSYPVLNFNADDVNGQPVSLKWFPSEYLYREAEDKYCMAIEIFSRPGEILLGGSFMRQNNYIFDLSTNRVGVARAKCNNDPNMVESE